jgi:hypothetical protein
MVVGLAELSGESLEHPSASSTAEGRNLTVEHRWAGPLSRRRSGARRPVGGPSRFGPEPQPLPDRHAPLVMQFTDIGRCTAASTTRSSVDAFCANAVSNASPALADNRAADSRGLRKALEIALFHRHGILCVHHAGPRDHGRCHGVFARPRPKADIVHPDRFYMIGCRFRLWAKTYEAAGVHRSS